MIDQLGIGLEGLFVVGGAIASLFKSFKFVHEGEKGIKLRWGRALRDKKGNPKIIKPGFIFMFPWIETLKRHHVRQQTIRMNNQQIMIKQGLIFNVSAVVMFRVSDIYRALFEIDDLDKSIEDFSMGVLRDVLVAKEYTELEDMKEISAGLLGELRHKAEEWGVEFIQFNLTDCSPTSETASLVNARAAVSMKLEALKVALDSVDTEDGTVGELPANLAAVLLGVPLTTSISEGRKSR